MSYKTIINSTKGIKIERLDENLWSAQSRPHGFPLCPKLKFKISENQQLIIVKHDLLRPFLLNSIIVTIIYIGIYLLSKHSVGLIELLYMILGSIIFVLLLIILIYYLTRIGVQNIKIRAYNNP
ncbi:hypothetical protein [Constantimarinum furrinae]|uniref:Uncharacterized protein n=1 Tax=Constantimarinum furrinae TaxID=2562285 RepID=A0A7G8PXD5_9FLAO|nr:hypothetical protein [Constantimarinum furrinae]QNJ99001.1 hypothetical protein ALE3EI_2465 [Constantimarinum furrinae]